MKKEPKDSSLPDPDRSSNHCFRQTHADGGGHCSRVFGRRGPGSWANSSSSELRPAPCSLPTLLHLASVQRRRRRRQRGDHAASSVTSLSHACRLSPEAKLLLTSSCGHSRPGGF